MLTNQAVRYGLLSTFPGSANGWHACDGLFGQWWCYLLLHSEGEVGKAGYQVGTAPFRFGPSTLDGRRVGGRGGAGRNS